MESRQYLGEAQAVPLRYTIREHLEKIGDPAGTSYPFSARYAYHPNGTVWEAEFYSAGSPATTKRYRYVFGTTSYDALNRLKSADYSFYSSGWQSTLAHDLAGIGYDLAGNITALQRYRETGSLIDNLTYSNATTSNRLNSVSDAVGTTTETWDAETGSFTYDANGNLTTAPAPYAITAVTYDHQNLPISLTSAGTTKTYRYNEAGQRITKQVGTGNTEVYLLDGMSSLGVFTVNGSGSVVASYFNVLAGDKVVGRQPATGNRRYYHTDLLGSTRAVVEGASVVESYDFEPWGLLMPGRTLAGPTKEGFTGKEQDAESGLDYFGARYYMPALGRWTSVDPAAQRAPEWSPYTYVLNNPVSETDPFGLCPKKDEECNDRKAEEITQLTQNQRQDQNQSREVMPEFPVPPARPVYYPECQGTARCTHWRLQNKVLREEYEEAMDEYHDAMMNHPLTHLALGFSGGIKSVGTGKGSSLFSRAGIETFEPHFSQRLLRRLPRGVTPEKALRAYNKGRLYYDPRSGQYVRHDSKNRISVVVTRPTNGRAVSVFEGKPSPEWVPVRWRP